MNKLSFTACVIGMQLLFILNSSAQLKTGFNTLPSPPANLKIDGNLKDWGDSLRYYSADQKINYALASDKDNLYVALRLGDRSDQIRLLNAGLTLGINTKGKKSNTYTVTFPAPDPNAPPHTALLLGYKADGSVITRDDRDELVRAKLNRLRDIQLSGFKGIESDMITTSNTYGFKTDIDYDANGFLVYEAAIPLKFLGEYRAGSDAWAFNFKINGIKLNENNNKQTGSEGGMGGGRRGGGMRGGGMGGNKPANNEEPTRNELYKSTDFWEKYYLAK